MLRAAMTAVGVPLIWWLIRFLGSTWRVRHVNRAPSMARPVVLAAHHCDLIVGASQLPAYIPTIDHLISRSGDGDIISRVVEFAGGGTIRGSSSRGGAGALRQSVRSLRAGRAVFFTVDGPRGPAQVVKPGVIQASAEAQVPIVYGVAKAANAWVFRSWDRMIIPKPFSKVVCWYGDPMPPPASTEPEVVEKARQDLERLMREMRAQDPPGGL